MNQKHDDACLRRRDQLGEYVCSCDMTDEQVQEHIDNLKRQIEQRAERDAAAREGNPPNPYTMKNDVSLDEYRAFEVADVALFFRVADISPEKYDFTEEVVLVAMQITDQAMEYVKVEELWSSKPQVSAIFVLVAAAQEEYPPGFLDRLEMIWINNHELEVRDGE